MTALALVLVTLGAAPALAVDQTLAGTKMMVQDRPGHGKLSVSSKSSGVTAPTPGGADDPTLAGGSLLVFNPNTSESATFDLPASGWSVKSGGLQFKYVNKLAPSGPSAVKVAVIKGGRQLKVSARASGITLNEASQGSIGVVLATGSRRYCLLFGGQVVRDQPGKFMARNASPPASCPSGGPTTTSSPGSTTTTVSSSTTTTTAIMCATPPPVSLGRITITVRAGTTDCGGPQLDPGAQPPLTGEVDFLNGSKRADLGLGCLYAGGGAALTPAFHLPDGAHTTLEVAGANGLAFEIAPSDGTGPADCTKGGGPGMHCLNGQPGTDTQGACTSDADCGNVTGSCDLDANCFFLNPIPLPLGGSLKACVLNAVSSDVCGSADLVNNQFNLAVNVSARIYVGIGGCPKCVSGSCTAGARSGLPCSGGVGSTMTTIECPPSASTFVGREAINFSGLTSGTATVTAPDGLYCPGQQGPGAFGGEAGTIRETGSPIFTGGPGPWDTTFAGILCVPSTGSNLFDGISDLPGPAAISVPVTVQVCLVPDVCNQLCNPCNLGPLCAVVCSPCLTCL